MPNEYVQMREVIEEAQRKIDVVDHFVGDFLKLCEGRIRHSRADARTLKRIKRELESFDARKGVWKS